MILPDHEIRRLCEEQAMVVPYNSDLQNPASLDVILGNRLMVEVEHTSELQLVDISHHSQEDPYRLAPGEFVLGETMETFCLPDDVAAQFVLKSSRARSGLEHLLAGYCDPGWHGSVLTLELHNSRRYFNIGLWPGMKIGQMVFHRLETIPDRTYAVTGRYNNDSSVTASRG